MADRIGLCEQDWNQVVFDGSSLVSCPTHLFQLTPFQQAIRQPGFFDSTVLVATCSKVGGFSEIISGANSILSCPENDFLMISRSSYASYPIDDDLGASISQIQYDHLWLLVFICGLLMAFGLGAIKGGQR
ncbi:tail virion protein G7P-2 [Marinospirillum sp. MEB164]|uniref:Tail virion protein G7P-2 n=1 Tax=Marinospirillum alkalitolerans TaxID=3123374 RepID=A0ABW8PX57_9GAMM